MSSAARPLVELVATQPTVGAALQASRAVAPPGLTPFLVAERANIAEVGQTVLVVASTAREAETLADELAVLMGEDQVALFPPWETLPHERLSPRADTVGRRLAVLRRLLHPEGTPLRVIVAPVRSVLQPQVKGLADLVPVEVHSGQDIELDDLVGRLADAAYARVDLVERRGEFAVRGGIVDVFPPTEDHPIRVEFWGDTVEDLRQFAVADQRTLEPVERLWAPPCRELLLTDAVRARARALSEDHPSVREMLLKIAEGHAVEGMESLAPVLAGEMEMLVELLPEGSPVVVLDPEKVRGRAADLVATSEEFLAASWSAAATGAESPLDLGAAAFRDLDDVVDLVRARRLPELFIGPFGLDEDDVADLG